MSILSDAIQQRVEDILVKDKLIEPDKLSFAKEQAKQANIPLFSHLVHQKIISNELLTKTIAHANNIPYVNLTTATIDKEVLKLLTRDTAERYMAVPLGEMQNRLAVAMIDAENVQAVDFLSTKIGKPLKVFAASEEGIRNILRQYDVDFDGSPRAVMPGQNNNPLNLKEKSGKDATNPEEASKGSSVSNILSGLLEYAATNSASDIHIEPLEQELKIRCRIDGVLREVMKLPKEMEPPLVSRVKILSNLKIDEHRIPQDGQFSVVVGTSKIDLRIAISPVVWGEQVVIRLLDKSGTSLKLEDMGYTGRALRTIREGLKRPNGMILTSGPTGSGKSTSLYALIQEIFTDEINIVTLEDPVEYKMPGINQIQVNPDVGLTFASGLRSILRQDPDVVMVGEIRDKETANLAVQAALTGHLVFSTLHTNSAAGILPRLLDMGVEPFLIASTVHTVIGQRLVRKVPDDKRRQEYQSDKVETEAVHATLGKLLPQKEEDKEAATKDLGYLTLPLANQNAYTLFKGTDGKETPGGYKGRMGLYEVFHVSDAIQELILKHSTSSEIQRMAQKEGMVTMREDGYLKALAGKTTLAEINRVAAAGEL